MARTVLLADDSVTAQNMGRRILMDAGYEVVTVNNGSAALKKIHENHPDLIVLDVYMPGYGGLEVCQRLKEAADTARIPVLLSVGKMEPFKAEEAKRVRADGHIVKPFEASELLAALTKLEDRIVPQPDAASTRRGKSEKPEKKSRLWHGGDPLAGAEEVPTERVAYLEEVKKRRAHEVESAEAGSSDQLGGGIAAEMPSPSAVERPVAVSAATEEFAVQESVVPSESDSQNAVEIQAADAVAEVPPIFEASTVEISAAENPAAGVAASEAPENQATVSNDSVAKESIPEVAEANVQPSDSAKAPAATVAASPVSAARWIAENVALSVEEASIALEAEMQQAHAASAAPVSQPEISAVQPVASSGKDKDKDNDAGQPAPETDDVNSSGAAFAAAASASGQPSAVSQRASAGVEATASVPEVAPHKVGPPELGPNEVQTNVESEPPSDATAAWANWQHIRDSVMSPQKAAEIAESMAEMAQAHAGLPTRETAVKEDLATKQDSSPSDSVSAAPAEPAAEDNSLNDIVDSVLADLKPRLMQEIAKKLAAKK